jgi:uncharacterized membrane protein YuzA (DUF378 family)
MVEVILGKEFAMHTRFAFVLISILSLAVLTSSSANAVTIGFENFAPVGQLVNVAPETPYTEAGYTITPTDNQSAVFDSAATNTMIGNFTDWFGFGETNTPMLTLTGPGPFDLVSAMVGPSTIASAIPISITITGNIFGSGTPLTSTFNNLTSATIATLNWSNLISVDFVATDDAGLDNITVVPEPSATLLMGLGLAALGCRRHSR